MKVCRRFKFDAAHRLPNYDGKCKNLHGHTWFLDVEVEGPVRKDGFVADFAELKKAVQKECLDLLDHTCLNDLPYPHPCFKNPTCENLIDWIWTHVSFAVTGLDRAGLKVSRVRLYESPDCYAELSW